MPTKCKNCNKLQQEVDGANALFSAIEQMYPNWQKFRDLAEAIKIHTSNQDAIIARLREDNNLLRIAKKDAFETWTQITLWSLEN